MTRLLLLSYKASHLSVKFKDFYGIHTDLTKQYKRKACEIDSSSISKTDKQFCGLVANQNLQN